MNESNDGPRRDLHEANRLSWNAATEAHNSHKGDQAAAFRAGASTLYPEEVALLGDVRGKRVVHLQCNSGQDSLSIARLGADVTGVDISDEAIDFATRLSAESGIPGTFVRADVYDWLADAAAAGERFDVVFSSYGALPWLSDIATWARGIAAVLAPGGRFVLVEFHPVRNMLESDWSVRYDYFPGAPMKWDEGIDDYVAQSGHGLGAHEPGIVDFQNPHPVWEFQWPVSSVIQALIDAGLTLERFEEYPYANGWKGHEGMREGEGRRMYPPESMPSWPMMFAVAATKPG